MRTRLILILLLVALVPAVFVLLKYKRPGPDPANQSGVEENSFDRLMSRGAAYLEKGDTNSISIYAEAVKLAPESVDARLNLANAYLLANDDPKALAEAQEALQLDRESAAGYYLMGLAHLHLNQAEKAVQAFQQSQKIDPAVTALNFQLGLAHEKLEQLEDAVESFETVLQFEPEHPSVHYQLSRLYQRLNRPEDAAREMKKHQDILARGAPRESGSRTFEISKHTQPRMIFKLEQPDANGVPVRFVDATKEAFGAGATNYHAPFAVLDYNHDGRNSLFVLEWKNGFRLLNNQRGRFEPLGDLFPAKSDARYRECLVGDLNNDRFEDVIVLGEQSSAVFRFATNGQAREVATAAGLPELKGAHGVMADLDFTGKLDLLTILPNDQGLRVYRNLGNFYFKENTNSGLPGALTGAVQVAMEDWNNDDVPGIFISRSNQPPVFFAKQRAGQFVQTNSAADWPAGNALATSDLNNDLRPDLVVGSASEIKIVFGGPKPKGRLEAKGTRGILLSDYDNDGWVDIMAYGDGVRVWRNVGSGGFVDVTAKLGFEKTGTISAMCAADFDDDGDTDFVLSGNDGLQFWRNDGGNANKQLKLRLVGNRSNPTGLGVRVDVMAGRWRTRRTLQRLPFEIGVGKHGKIDLLRTHWFDLSSTVVDLGVTSVPVAMAELTVPAGSCPYLYAWDGTRFRFVTDMLGASPLGLPMAEGKFIEPDPEEFLALGNETTFPAKDGAYEIRITEELREVLYLDQARLVVVDHPAGTVVYPTSKLRPGGPFPPHELWTMKPLRAPSRSVRSDGLDATEALAKTDNKMVSPVRIREPQLRGLAEPFSVTMDFGVLETERPLVLAITGWLRFGGGMANISAARDPSLPYPFPTLEAELPDGTWKPVSTDVGAPAGKTKTILVDLAGKLPEGARRLRLTTAFEIHWDSVLLCERVTAETRQLSLTADKTHLHWRGFSEFEDLPSSLPLTPRYEKTSPVPPWSRAVSGWCTRYGEVNGLLDKTDDQMALINGGDELALSFKAESLPPKRSGMERDFFLFVVGWDKDADFHVEKGWEVNPLPSMNLSSKNDLQPQATGKYLTRWVGPVIPTKQTASK